MVAKQSVPLSQLTAITPLDGRYRNRTQLLADYTSEYALIKTRFEIEAKYLLALSKSNILRKLTPDEEKTLNSFSEKITLEVASEVKKIEEQTRHDVKALERVFRSLVHDTTLQDIVEMIHVGLTSEDINNLSYRLMLKRATHELMIPELQKILDWLVTQSEKHKSTPMLARTHGQPAVPTTLGKELVVFAYRLFKELKCLKERKLTGKFSGAVGNFNALQITYPDTDWIAFSRKFVSSLELESNIATTQINTYEDIVSFFQNYHRMNSILIDLNQDMWRYISDNWFTQVTKKGEVGSSTMPQKVNPIDFENSEGNLGLANGLAEHFARKLPISRLQRDLTDSTTIRNIGTALGFSLMGYLSMVTGLSRVNPNIEQITKDLNIDWSILGEGVQTVLRKEGVEDPYSLVASLTRGEHIDKDKWQEWIGKLEVTDEVKKSLNNITPSNYIGLAVQIVDTTLAQISSAPKKL